MSHNNHNQSILPVYFLSLATLFYFYEFLLQMAPNVMSSSLAHALNADATSLGYMSATYFLGYGVMQIPVGILLDRFGSKKLLALASLVCAIGSFCTAVAHSMLMIDLGRFLVGIGSAFASVGCMNIAARWFHPKRFALLVGIIVSIGMLGAIFGEAPLSVLINHFGWRMASYLFGGIGLILALMIWLGMSIRTAHLRPYLAETYQAPLLEGLTYIIKEKNNWIGAIYGGLSYSPALILGALWGIPFFIRIAHFSQTTSATLVSMLFIGFAVGTPFFGWLSDQIKRRKPPLWIASTCSFLIITIVIYIPHLSFDILAVLLGLFGFCLSGFVVVFSLISESNPAHFSATSLGFINMFNMLIPMLSQASIGFLLDFFWQGKFTDHAKFYSGHTFHLAFFVIPLLFILSLILLPFIKETYGED